MFTDSIRQSVDSLRARRVALKRKASKKRDQVGLVDPTVLRQVPFSISYAVPGIKDFTGTNFQTELGPAAASMQQLSQHGSLGSLLAAAQKQFAKDENKDDADGSAGKSKMKLQDIYSLILNKLPTAQTKIDYGKGMVAERAGRRDQLRAIYSRLRDELATKLSRRHSQSVLSGSSRNRHQQQQQLFATAGGGLRETIAMRRIRYARESVKNLFVCLEVLADAGITLSAEQVIMVRAIWGSVLPQICGDDDTYEKLKSEFKASWNLEYIGKGHTVTAARRTGKSFGFSLAMACLAAVCMNMRIAFINLFSAAGATNLDYFKLFIGYLQNDPKKRIRCVLRRWYKLYYLEIGSHMQSQAKDDNLTNPIVDDGSGQIFVVPEQGNMLCSLPNMDSGGGRVRFSFTFFAAETGNTPIFLLRSFLDEPEPWRKKPVSVCLITHIRCRKTVRCRGSIWHRNGRLPLQFQTTRMKGNGGSRPTLRFWTATVNGCPRRWQKAVGI